MVWIKYPVTEFVEPPRLMAHEYNEIKDQFELNPDFEIFQKGKSYFEHFKKELFFWSGCIAGGVLSITIGDSIPDGWIATILLIPGAISLFLGLIGLYMHLVIGATKFALYKRKRRKYYKKMKKEIQKSNSYSEFLNSFYSK
jgi:hypothetical protein